MTNLQLPAPAPRNDSPTSSTAVSSDAPALPAPSDAPHVDPQREIEWKSSLKNLEHHMEAYKDHAKGSGASERDAEQVAKAMEQVADSHTDPKVKMHWREKARIFRAAGAEERDGILEEIGKGFLMLLTTPFLLVGAVLQAAGGILNGVGSILKGLGRLTRKLTYTGSSSRRESVQARDGVQ